MDQAAHRAHGFDLWQFGLVARVTDVETVCKLARVGGDPSPSIFLVVSFEESGRKHYVYLEQHRSTCRALRDHNQMHLSSLHSQQPDRPVGAALSLAVSPMRDRTVDLPCPAFVDPCTLALSDRGVVRDAKCKIIAGYFLRDAHDALIKIEKELKASRASAAA
ncbi:hypothetical protein H9P43_006446 [Blastocladiella emersonii ATCC 22665]|nr:hypothetical protein H9P43_006446 [Blastocladiella emersonii ATCC 22665]